MSDVEWRMADVGQKAGKRIHHRGAEAQRRKGNVMEDLSTHAAAASAREKGAVEDGVVERVGVGVREELVITEAGMMELATADLRDRWIFVNRLGQLQLITNDEVRALLS